MIVGVVNVFKAEVRAGWVAGRGWMVGWVDCWVGRRLTTPLQSSSHPTIQPSSRTGSGWDRRFEHIENALRGGQAGCAGVKAGAQKTQRQVELGGQQQDEKSLLEGQVPIQQAQADFHRYARRADGGHHL